MTDSTIRTEQTPSNSTSISSLKNYGPPTFFKPEAIDSDGDKFMSEIPTSVNSAESSFRSAPSFWTFGQAGDDLQNGYKSTSSMGDPKIGEPHFTNSVATSQDLVRNSVGHSAFQEAGAPCRDDSFLQ